MRLVNTNIVKGGTKEGGTWGPRFAVAQSVNYWPTAHTFTEIMTAAKSWAPQIDPRPEITARVVRRELRSLVASGEVQVQGRGRARRYSRPFDHTMLDSGMETGADFE